MLSFFGSCVALAMYGLFALLWAAGKCAMSRLVGKPKASVKKPGPAEAWLKANEFSTAAAIFAEKATTTPQQREIIVDVAEIYFANTGARFHPYTSMSLCEGKKEGDFFQALSALCSTWYYARQER